jgi:hypothetical protein
MSVLNKNDKCACGREKEWTKQWCNYCFECLTEDERQSFTKAVNKVRVVIDKLQARINERTKSGTQSDEC